MSIVAVWVEDGRGRVVINEQTVKSFASKNKVRAEAAAEMLIDQFVDTGKLSATESYYVRNDFSDDDFDEDEDEGGTSARKNFRRGSRDYD